MRILVVLDSHGHTSNLLNAFDAEPYAEYAFFLGDGVSQAEDAFSLYSHKVTCKAVRGNCDFCSNLPDFDTISVKGIKIYMAHGHIQQVKFGLERLKSEAAANGAQIALFGHTHKQFYKYEQGIHLFNPGSIQERKYGVIDIAASGVVCVMKRLRP